MYVRKYPHIIQIAELSSVHEYPAMPNFFAFKQTEFKIEL
jgi:hypothetical protein